MDSPQLPGLPQLLTHLAALGPFFALQAHDPDTPARSPWRPLSALTDDPSVLRARVDDARAHLAAASLCPPETVELRVATSVVHLGLAARLVSPTLALAAVAGVTASLDLAAARWQNVPGSTFPLSLPREQLLPQTAAQPADERWVGALVDGPLRDLALAASALSVSPRVLWGNVASAVNGAAAVLTCAVPGHAEQTRDLAVLLLNHPALRNTSSGTPGSSGFRRRSCCLIYRAAPDADGALCGDCVLRGRR